MILSVKLFLPAGRGLALALLLCSCAWAQRARIVGTVSDPSGAAVPGALVRATNAETRLSWKTRTDAQGRFVLELLPPGAYAVGAGAGDFSPAEASDVRLEVNATQRVDLELALAARREQVQVSANVRRVENETSELGAVIGEKMIKDLPLNGRDFLQLARLAPGVSPANDIPSSPSGPFNVNGQRDLSNNILIDGINVNAGGSARGRISLAPGSDTAAGQAGSSVSLISVDAISEFKLQSQLHAAEFGGSAGAVVNVNSKSGGNEVHGSAFEFLRNSSLDANNFFFNANSAPKPPTRNNIFGGTMGGPVRKDRTFYFASLEALRQRLGVSSNARVPSREARAQAGAAVRPLIDLYPLPTGSDSPDGTAPYFAAGNNLVGETAFSLRIDHRLTEKDDFFARYSFSDSLGVLRSFYLNFLTNNRSRLQNATLSHVRRITPLLYHEAKFGVVRSANHQLGALDSFGGARPVRLDAEGNAVDPGILVFSLPFAVAHNPLFVQNNNLFTFTENLTAARGRHTLRVGVWLRRVQGNINLKPLTSGVYFFDTVEELLDNNPSLFFNQAARSGFGVRFTNLAWYAQVDHRLTPRLTLNLGLRYELNTVPGEAHSRFSPIVGLGDLATATLGAPGTRLHNSDRNNFAPRFGFAYRLTGDARTVLRGGFGVYYDTPTLNAVQPALGPPFKITNLLLGAKLGGPVRVPVNPALLPATITGKPPFGSAAVYDPENFRTPYTYHYNLNVQRELDPQTLAQASLVGALGRRLIRFRPLNLLDPATGAAPNSNFAAGALQLIETTAQSNYHGFQLNVHRRLDRGLSVIASYTVAHSLDEVSNGTGTSVSSSFTASNPHNLRAEYASSDFDIRQNLVAAFTYDLPVAQNRWRGPAGKFLQGWSIQGILSAQTGLPFTALLGQDVARNGEQWAANNQRPNLVAGRPLYISSSAPPFRTVTPEAFSAPATGAYGNAGRNILRSKSLQQLDGGLQKNTKVNERVALQFRAELFNLLNHPNFATPAAASNHLLTAGKDFGLSKQMANESGGGFLGPLFNSGGPRSIQFALKLLY